jgi:eukaryotic-like serine/threonine-protein kinase
MIGQTISHYRILEKLGAGGMGVVYKAQDTRLDRAVALKFLPEHLLDDPLALERFRREVHAASMLNHPGICTIYDADEAGGKPFIAMEFIDGETLRQFIKGKPLPLEPMLTLGIQLADAISAAHGEGIIHRDLKPANIFVTKRGQAKVLDFGLAKLVPKTGLIGNENDTQTGSGPAAGGGGQSAVAAAGAVGGGARGAASGTHAAVGSGSQDAMSIVGVISGTPSYMSPEQIRGDDLDARTDVFSLGLLLYEMATGKQAYTGNTGGAVIEMILTKAPVSVRSLNPEVPVELEAVINKALSKEVLQRYQSAADVCADLSAVKRGLETGHTVATVMAMASRPGETAEPSGWRKYKWAIVGLAAVVVAGALGGWLYKTRQAQALGESDTIVLADFMNKTGDAVFDDTLRQGLAAQLQQSPFLNLLSEQKIQQTLLLMGKPADAKLTPEIARDVCQRSGSKAYLSGSIANMGSQYVIGINAVNCQTGDALALQQVTADNKEKVLSSLDAASTKLRETLGESLKTIHKLDTPIEQATTPSLEALQAYSLGRKTMMGKGDYAAAVPMFERAITLDNRFAMAYAMLGTCYSNMGERNLSEENTQHSYALRGHVSEWEKFYIDSHYYHFVTGDLEKARQVYEQWAQTYPRESVPPGNLGVIYPVIGQYEKGLAETQEALRVAPGVAINYANLVETLTRLNRFGDARAAMDEVIAKRLESPDTHFYDYTLSFLQHDQETMAKEAKWAAGKPADENVMLYMTAEVAAQYGQLSRASELSRSAVDASVRAGQKEIAARCEGAAALREATFGNNAEARQRANAALAFSHGRDEEFAAGLALAMAGDSATAQGLADDLAKKYPQDTIVQFHYLPTMRAQLALNQSEKSAGGDGGKRAVELLQAAAPYELGAPGNGAFILTMYPVYVRGMAYLRDGQGTQAVAEFQKIVEHPGVAVSEPIAVLAYLGLARGYRAAGDVPKAKAAYEDFFQQWKAADAEVPVLVAAKAEYGKLG